jgi:D-3-phosphoglycerate dehydrogenase / 2-oxoglutarate reductase
MAVLVFDFDSTLVSVEGLDELFARSLDRAEDREGRLAAFEEITDLGMSGEISAEDSLSRRLSVLEADRRLVDEVGQGIAERLSPSVLRNLPFFLENMDRIHVVSGGFEELIHPTLMRMGIPFSHLHAHRFLFDSGGRVIGLDPDTVMARGGKPQALARIGPSGSGIWMVGDGATDLEVRELGLADRFVAFTENRHREPVVAKADHVARSMDELLTILENR